MCFEILQDILEIFFLKKGHLLTKLFIVRIPGRLQRILPEDLENHSQSLLIVSGLVDQKSDYLHFFNIVFNNNFTTV